MFKNIGALFFFVFACSCATHQNAIAPIQMSLQNGNCLAALQDLDKMSSPESNDQLLYLMEYGSALQICHDYAKSNSILHQADKLSEQIDYLSLSRAVGATLLNEQMIQYKGDKFEKLFINTLSALNYLELNDYENAMVEVRRINEKTKKFAEDEKRNFELNSFASYLAGLIYEFDKQFDDACIAYKQAYTLDPSYRVVVLDLLSACWRAKRTQEFKELVKLTNASSEEVEIAKDKKIKKNEKVIIYLQGWGPKKSVRSEDVRFPILKPSFSSTKRLMVSAKSLENNFIKTSSLVYNVETAAIQTLEEDYKTIGIRRFGARVAKEIVADQIRQKDKALGELAWLVMVASERADLRNWSLLPETIQVLRINSDEVNSIQLLGRGIDDQQTELLGEIDFADQPLKKIYVVRSLK